MQAEIGALQDAGSWLNELCLFSLGTLLLAMVSVVAVGERKHMVTLAPKN
jgi:hypothetical protein